MTALFVSYFLRTYFVLVSVSFPFYKKHKIIFTMKPIPNPTLSASKGEFPEPSSKPKISQVVNSALA